ncbi:MAG: phosphomannose isomerase type II C-terminal cupin domain [Candidatus Delongbacteria bacterium]|jgi:mannose-6-phosphate isomerase|nr:phosphomannose isomerase type II C-terminal cupin domain [Candidatus Delongbacteria bacterium]
MYTEERPWGSFTILEDTKTYKAKRIIVKPKQRLSYQSHEKRDELWIIVAGQAKVTLDGVDIILSYGENIVILKQQKHRIENVGDNDVIFIEVQTGTYFGEDDIVRYDDDYKRA